MKISTKGRYALRMMIELALEGGKEYTALHAIARRIGVNSKYLEQITNGLVKAGLLQVMRGSAGGYRLCRRPDEYTTLEILEAVEGKLAPVSCLETDVNLCDRSLECAVLPFWQDLYGTVSDFLKEVTLADFVDGKYAVNMD